MDMLRSKKKKKQQTLVPLRYSGGLWGMISKCLLSVEAVTRQIKSMYELWDWGLITVCIHHTADGSVRPVPRKAASTGVAPLTLRLRKHRWWERVSRHAGQGLCHAHRRRYTVVLTGLPQICECDCTPSSDPKSQTSNRLWKQEASNDCYYQG